MVVIFTDLLFSKFYPEVGQPFYSRKSCHPLYSQAYTTQEFIKRIGFMTHISKYILVLTAAKCIKPLLNLIHFTCIVLQLLLSRPSYLPIRFRGGVPRKHISKPRLYLLYQSCAEVCKMLTLKKIFLRGRVMTEFLIWDWRQK